MSILDIEDNFSLLLVETNYTKQICCTHWRMLLKRMLRISYPVICTFKHVTCAAFLVDFGKIRHQFGNLHKVSSGKFLAQASDGPKKKIHPSQFIKVQYFMWKQYENSTFKKNFRTKWNIEIIYKIHSFSF